MFCRIAIYALLLWFFLQGWKIAFSAQHQGVDSFDCLHHIVVILNLKQTHLKFPTKVLRRSAKYFSSLLKHTWRRRQGRTHRLVNLLITGWPRSSDPISSQPHAVNRSPTRSSNPEPLLTERSFNPCIHKPHIHAPTNSFKQWLTPTRHSFKTN